MASKVPAEKFADLHIKDPLYKINQLSLAAFNIFFVFGF